jgi:hypothetical protein
MRRFLLPMIVSAAVLALAACAKDATDAASPGAELTTAGCATATSPPAMEIDGTPQPANQEALDGLAGRVRAKAEADFADVYTGLRLLPEQNRIEVFRKPSAAFDDWVGHEFAGDCVQLTTSDYSAKELEARQALVVDDLDYWRRQGIEVRAVSADIVRGVVVAGVAESDVDDATKRLPAHYGAGVPIKVEPQGAITPA